MLPAYGYAFGFIKDFSHHAASDLPPEAWWLPALVLFILGLTALIDAFSSTVPDPLIFLGLLAVTGMQGLYISWPSAAHHLLYAIGAAVSLWMINIIWFKFFKQDAFGMGDAKWTMLAVACFDATPVLFAWGLGACLAVIWMGILNLTRYQITRVYFAPFLFIGLCGGIYWLRLRGYII